MITSTTIHQNDKLIAQIPVIIENGDKLSMETSKEFCANPFLAETTNNPKMRLIIHHRTGKKEFLQAIEESLIEDSKAKHKGDRITGYEITLKPNVKITNWRHRHVIHRKDLGK